MEFSKVNGVYAATILFSNGFKSYARFDTGAVCTVLSYSDVLKAYQTTESVFDKALSKHQSFSLHGAVTGQHAEAVPCRIEDIEIAGCALDSLLFMVSKDLNMSLIGADFIDACTIHKAAGGNIKVLSFNSDMYAQIFSKRWVYGTVYTLHTGDSPVQWYNSLSEVDKRLLYNYSTLLADTLVGGQFYEELRPLYDGFRRQYNI